MRTIEISANYTGVISTSNFENLKPMYGVTETVEIDDLGSSIYTDEMIKGRQKVLQDICKAQFVQEAETAYLEKIKKQYQHIRFYGDYPSVTSVLGYDDDFRISELDLAQYGARGTIIHKQVEVFLKDGEWKDPLKLSEIYPEYVTLRKGSLGLTLEGFNFQEFYKSYPFKVLDLEAKVISDEHKYGGRRDIKCVIESENKGKWDKVDGVLYDVPLVADVKTGQIDKPKCLAQCTAYGKPDPEIKGIFIIPLNQSTAQGFSKPIFECDMDRWWPYFLDKREKFKGRFGI